MRGNKDRFFMSLLTGYFDESGIHNGDHLCVVAGFVGNDAQWQAFIADWIPAISPRKNLHMKDLRWKQQPERIAALLRKLGPIPYKYNLKPVSAGLFWRDYNSIVKGKIDEKFTHPYVVCATCCMAVVLKEIAEADDVYFLFDRQEGMRRETMLALHDIVYNNFGIDSRVKGMDFIKRDSTVCLDPADYLAFVVRERGTDKDSIKAKLGNAIMPKTRGYGGRLAPNDLADMVEGWQRKITPLEMLPELMKNPFFRGPKRK
jgi:hypothetical protein